MREKRKDSTISSQTFGSFECIKGRFRDYNGNFPRGRWYSPFFLETEGVKEPEGAGAIPAPATRSDFAPVKVRFSLNTGDKTAVHQAPFVLFTSEMLYGRLSLCMEIYFTKHADEKFATLARHGVKILRKKVIDAVMTPDVINCSRLPLLIAQSDIDKTHVL